LTEWLKQTYGGSIRKRKPAKETYSPAEVWQIANNKALDFLSRVVPYLKEHEKLRRAQLLLNQYKMVTPRNGKYNIDQKMAKEKFEAEFFSGRRRPGTKIGPAGGLIRRGTQSCVAI
jgi:hypothetical protein